MPSTPDQVARIPKTPPSPQTGAAASGPVSRGWKHAGTVVLLALAVVLLLFVLNFVVMHPQGTLDFAHLYSAATILRQGNASHLYDLNLQRQIELRVTNATAFLPSYHTPIEMLVYWPFAYLPYRWAFLAWAGFNLLLLAALFGLLRRTGYQLDGGSRLIWLAVCFPLVAGNLALGQDGLLLALVFLFGYLALKRGGEFAGGLIFGLGLFRFEVLLPFAFVFFLRRRWKFMWAFSIAGAAELFVSWLMIGRSGMMSYAHIILKAGQVGGNAMSADVGAMPSLRGALVSFFGSMIPSAMQFPLVLVGTLALLGIAAWKLRCLDRPADPAFDLQFSLCVVAALLSSYHLFTEVCTPLIVVGFLILGYESARQSHQALADRKGSMLLLLFALVLVVAGAFGFREWSVLFVVLLGLWTWLVQEAHATGGYAGRAT